MAASGASTGGPGAPQGRVPGPGVPVTGACAWYASDWAENREWVYELNAEDLRELDAAVERVRRLGRPLQDVGPADVALPTLGPRLEALRREVQWGRGFALLRGFPVERYSRQDTIAGYWCMGLYWGSVRPQNGRGHLVGHVKDITSTAAGGGGGDDGPATRIYRTCRAQPFHVDSSDLVALLCLQPAVEGGDSSWASAVTAHNEVLARAPELAATLACDWHLDRKGEVPAGAAPFCVLPIFNLYRGHLSVQLHNSYYELAQRHAEVPRMSEAQRAALALLNGLVASDALRFDWRLEKGDLQLLNNLTVVHARTAFVDHPDPALKRHLLRMWFAPPDGPPLPPAYAAAFYGSVVPGARGGAFLVPGMEANPVPLDAE